MDAAKRLATADDLRAYPDDRPAEVIAGNIVERASPSAEHGDAQLGLGSLIRGSFHGGGGHGLGGWWILTEVEVELEAHDVFRPDIVGWKRSRLESSPKRRPVKQRPDWICEILSPSHAQHDLFAKFRAHQRVELPHYWLLDPIAQNLIVYRWSAEGYIAVLNASADQVVRAEPFEAIEFRLADLFGSD